VLAKQQNKRKLLLATDQNEAQYRDTMMMVRVKVDFQTADPITGNKT